MLEPQHDFTAIVEAVAPLELRKCQSSPTTQSILRPATIVERSPLILRERPVTSSEPKAISSKPSPRNSQGLRAVAGFSNDRHAAQLTAVIRDLATLLGTGINLS